MTLNEAATVTFTPHWGTSSHYEEYQNHGANEEWYIQNGEIVTIGVLKTLQLAPVEESVTQETAPEEPVVEEAPEETGTEDATGEATTEESQENVEDTLNEEKTEDMIP